MADTLAEIVNTTLTNSDFNSNGEATLLTTDANTTHVIKDLQLAEGSSAIASMPATLNVNNMDVGEFSANASGNEIIAPSSTVKISSDTFPLTYEDFKIFMYDSSNYNVRAYNLLKVNGISDSSLNNWEDPLISDYRTYTSGTTYLSKFTQMWIDPLDRLWIIQNDGNSTTQLQCKGPGNTNVFSDTGGYEPRAYDHERYVYWHQTDDYLWRVDTHAANPVAERLDWSIRAVSSGSTYADACVTSNGPNRYHYWFRGSTSGAEFLIRDLNNETIVSLNNSGGLSNHYDSSSRFYAYYDNEDKKHVFVIQRDQTVALYDIPTSDGGSFSEIKTFTLDPQWASAGNGMGFFYEHYYYYIATDNTLRKLNVKDETSEVILTGITNAFAYNDNSQLHIEIPDASTIAGRSYTIEPSLKVRATGVTVS